MDRSSMRRVETTHDTEKRLAFKAKLASKIVEQESLAPPAPVHNFSIGTSLWHPDLGEGVLVSLDEKTNQIVIDFQGRGPIELIYSSTLQHLSLTNPFVEKVEDCFSADVIDRTPMVPVRDFGEPRSINIPESSWFKPAEEFAVEIVADTKSLPAQSAFYGEEIDRRSPQLSEGTRIPSPDLVREKPIQIPEIEAGTNVWHPDFGACMVNSVDEKANLLVLRVLNQDRELELVLSQAKSKLILTNAAPETVPFKQAPNKTLLILSEDSNTRVLKVQLPTEFKKWTLQNQFNYLTRNQHLTTDEANDVFAKLNGDVNYGEIIIDWEEVTGPTEYQTPVEATFTPPEMDQSLVGKQVWHLDLGPAIVLSVDSRYIVLDFPDKGKLEMVLSHTQPRLSLAEAAILDHASNYVVPAKQEIKIVKEEVVKNLTVILPPVFGSWDTKKQYSYLATEKHLTPEESNDVLSLIHGKGQTTKTMFTIEWSENADLDKIEAANRRLEVKPEKKIYSTRPVVEVATGVNRTVEDKVVVKKEITAHKLSITLPQTFKTWPISSQYVFLTRTKQLTANEANDIVDILQGKPQLSHVLFDIRWDEQ